MLNLLLQRMPTQNGTTLGELLIAGTHECFTCEDAIRDYGDKVPKETAIFPGRYRIDITFSQRFQRRLPLLLEVPYFVGIRIHTGNTKEDTEGCILVGEIQRMGRVDRSKIAFDKLFPKIEDALAKGEECWIDVRNP